MATYRGQDGILVLGGFLTGTILVNGAVASLGTTVNFDAASLVGILMPGDQFQVGANVYTVTSGPHVASLNALTGVTFTPGAVGGFADNAPVTFLTNSMAQTQTEGITSQIDILDTTGQGDNFRTCRGGRKRHSITGEALLDYDDPPQASLIDAVLSGTSEGIFASLFVGFTRNTMRDFYGAGKLSQVQVQEPVDRLAMLTFTFQVDGNLRLSWTDDTDDPPAPPGGLGDLELVHDEEFEFGDV